MGTGAGGLASPGVLTPLDDGIQGQPVQPLTLAVGPENILFVMAAFSLTKVFQRHEVSLTPSGGSPSPGEARAREADPEAKH